MLYQTQAEINIFYCQVIQKVAASGKVQVADWDMKSTVELLQEINNVAPDVRTLLQDFLTAYQRWYSVHVEIDTAGTAGKLTVPQGAQLQSAITDRDATRAALLAAL